MAAKFDTDLARVIVHPGRVRFTPVFRTHLIKASKRVIEVRQRTLTYLDAAAAEFDRLDSS